ncbi:MAG: M20/M25/M40 family metallo-hydrolase [Candidatus Omnitrophica bacterium]|nr:M20/M25/M40 family metallo-hydrolase [Candidatus Omnitrophota bacterium]MBU1808174.1 M20/M25/M40 family metallo-hydrolase [Candidatus Omnitrophota bacterium]
MENTVSIERLKAHVYKLSHDIGERGLFKYDNLNKAADYIAGEFRSFGYEVTFQKYNIRNRIFRNIVVTKAGNRRPGEVIILGAHYDSMRGPGADDNASAVAGLLETARMFSAEPTGRTVKFIAFTNEEPPLFKKKSMGSMVYAKAARENNVNIKGALILEMIGYFSDRSRSQHHPPGLNLFYPDKGNFIAIIGNAKSKKLISYMVSSFRKVTDLPIERAVVPNVVIGIGMSDDWSFWKEGYPAVMITDTAYYRNPNYHKKSDTYDTLDYKSMAKVTKGVAAALKAIAK